MSGAPDTVATATPSADPCAACGAPLAHDQRYCLQCGELRLGMRREPPELLRGSIHGHDAVPSAVYGGGDRWPRLAATLAGVACLLLAMGIGVLIGRGGGAAATAPAPITIAGDSAAAAAPATAFTDDWPAAKDGWTIALDVLPKASTQPVAVAAAKSAATGKGATAVGALDADAHPSLTGGSYVVYSGVYDARKAATDALAALKASFAGARVVHVATTAPAGSTASGSGSGSPGSSSPGGSAKRASPSTSGKSGSKGASARDTKKAFEQSKKAPKTDSTGGRPPPKDNKPAAGGGAVQEIG